MLRRLIGAASVAVIILIWWILTAGATPESRIISPVVLPSPAEVLGSLGSLFTERALLQSIVATLKRVLLGFGLAVLVGVPVGVLAGRGA